MMVLNTGDTAVDRDVILLQERDGNEKLQK